MEKGKPAKGSEAMKKRMAYVRSFRKAKKGKMSPKRTVKAASPRRATRKTSVRKSRKSPTRKTSARKSPTRKSRKSPMRMRK